MMSRRLVEIISQVQSGHHAVVILNGAAWHQPGSKIKIPDNIFLLHIPPYSPEINPVEDIWRHLRQNLLSNRFFADYGEILNACCDAWNALTGEPGRIRSIASRARAKVKV